MMLESGQQCWQIRVYSLGHVSEGMAFDAWQDCTFLGLYLLVFTLVELCTEELELIGGWSHVLQMVLSCNLLLVSKNVRQLIILNFFCAWLCRWAWLLSACLSFSLVNSSQNCVNQYHSVETHMSQPGHACTMCHHHCLLHHYPWTCFFCVRNLGTIYDLSEKCSIRNNCCLIE